MTMARESSPATIAPDAALESPRSIWADAFGRLLSGWRNRICIAIVALYVLTALSTFVPRFTHGHVETQEIAGEKRVVHLFDPMIQGTVEVEGIKDPTYLSPHFLQIHDPQTGKVSPRLWPFAIWMGTDIQGRSVIWRLLYGSRIALIIAVLASVISLGLGVMLGIIAGYFGRWIDEAITWLYTTVSSIPWILLVLALVYALKGKQIYGQEIPELYLIILALGLTDWVGICRLIRGEVIKHRDRDYVLAARAMGVGTPRILLRHILPNVFHLVIITFSLGAVSYVQAEVALTFLGLGISSEPSWGRMIDDAKLELLKGVWWQMVFATVAMGILCLALNILGDALRDALDPRLRGVD